MDQSWFSMTPYGVRWLVNHPPMWGHSVVCEHSLILTNSFLFWCQVKASVFEFGVCPFDLKLKTRLIGLVRVPFKCRWCCIEIGNVSSGSVGAGGETGSIFVWGDVCSGECGHLYRSLMHHQSVWLSGGNSRKYALCQRKGLFIENLLVLQTYDKSHNFLHMCCQLAKDK